MDHYWRYDKILPLAKVEALATSLKSAGKKLVTVNGAFDLLHAGHLDFLEEAKQQGDILFVGINSDQSVRDKKGSNRPYVPEPERAALLAALACVDYVTIIDATYSEVQNVLLRAVKPAIHVNGSEYGAPESWVEWPVMQEVGAAGHTVTRRVGLATSDLLKKIQSAPTS